MVHNLNQRINPLFNEAFVRIFGQEKSKHLTRSLVNTILEAAGLDPMGDIVQIGAEHSSFQGSVFCKTPRFDVRLVSESSIIDLEAQLYPEDSNNRAAYYAAAALVEGSVKAMSYKDIPQVVVITLLDDKARFPQSGDFVHICRWNWEVEGRFHPGTDRQILVLVELSKIHERYTTWNEDVLRDKLLSWTYLIAEGYRNEGEVDAIMASYPDIEEFAEMYGLAINDPKVVQAFKDAQSAEWEYRSRQDYFERITREATEAGLEEGREEGRAKGRADLVEKLRALGVDEAVLQEALAQA